METGTVDVDEEQRLWARIERKTWQAFLAERLADDLRHERHRYAESQAEIASLLDAEALALIQYYEEHRAA